MKMPGIIWKTALILFGLFLSFAPAHARSAIRGLVTNAETGAPVEGATVVVEGAPLASVVENARIETLTKTNGRYDFPNLPPGEYQLSASLPGFNSPRVTVQLGATKAAVQNFTLIPRPVSEAYRIETIPLPPEMSPEISGIDFTPDGKIVLCNRLGEVWIGDLHAGSWHRFAYGLYEPFGLVATSGNVIHVLQRPEITVVSDTDADGIADRYATLSDAWGITGNYHEFSYGLRTDSKGNFYGGLGMASAGEFDKTRGPLDLDPVVPWDRLERKTDQHRSVARYQGWVFQTTPAGKFIPWASGFRQPLGIGLSPDDELFVTDVAGSWIPSSQLLHAKRGHFYGHPEGLKWDPAFAGKTVTPELLASLRAPPAVMLVHGRLGTSPGEPVWDTTGGHFGPFEGQLFIGDVTPFIMRVFLQKVAGEYQGAAFPFLRERGLRLGNMRNVFGPDGHLYLGQTIRGWREAEEGLQRIVWTGDNPVEIRTMELTEAGFRLTFTEPMDLSSLALPGNFAVTRFQYSYHILDGALRINEAAVPVTEVRPGEDGLHVEFSLTELLPGFVYELQAPRLRSQKNQPLDNPSAYYTCTRLLSGETFIETPETVANPAPPFERTPDIEAGKATYHLYCAACHQPDGRGSDEIKSASFVGENSPLRKSDAEIARIVSEGVTRNANEEPAMPPFGQALTQQEIKDVLAYLRAAFGTSGTKTD